MIESPAEMWGFFRQLYTQWANKFKIFANESIAVKDISLSIHNKFDSHIYICD
jgi:hypothetical protein